MGWTLSVDYGTTNTTAAVRHEGRSPTAVPLGPEGTMPSATLLTSGGIEVGEAALAGRRTAPEYFVGSPKLLLGQDAVLLGDSEVEVADLVARTLSVVLEAAVRAAGGGEPEEVVLTHPQTWARPRRSALEAAWRRTGSRARVRMVSEPIAAVSWFADTDALPDDARVAVLDFGGGTCDVAVLHHTGGASAPLEITAHAGLDDLGGVTIDHVFALWVRAQVRAQGLTELDDALGEREHLTSLHALYDAVREAKHRLADWEYADVPVAADGRETTVTVTINEFNQIIAAETERARALLERSIAAAGTTPGELHGLYLTGGSSRLRWVHQMAAELLDGRPAHLAEPHLVVALGAHSATRVRVVERVDAESSRFITLRGLQALPGGTSRSLPLPPPTGLPVSSTPPRRGAATPPPPPSAAARIPGPAPVRPAAGVAAPKGPPVRPPAGAPTGPPPPHLRQAGPPPPATALNRAGDGAASRPGASVIDTLLAAQPALRDATTVSPELRGVLEAPAVLVALLSVPGLLDQVARHPALMTVPVSDGSDRTFTTPDDPDSALLPVRLFFAGRPAWQRALDDPAWRHAFLGAQHGGPVWAHALLQRWPHLPDAERARALDDPGWRLPLPPTPPWIDRAPGRLTVRVPAAAAGAGTGAGFLRPRAASPVQADLLGVLEARGAFDGGEAFRERLNAARDPRLPAHRATVALHLGGRPVDDVELYLFPGGRHRGGSGSGDRDLPPYVLLLPSRARRTTTPLLALTRDLVDAVVQVPGPPGTHIATHVVSLVLTREAGSPTVPTGGGVELSGRDPGLGVDLARALDRPWRGR